MTNFAAVKRVTLRILRKAAFTLIALLLAATIFVQIQQRIFRSRCEHLLADIQAIRLHQTTWAEAQTLMHRWGEWGHYDGTCDATNCKYKIAITGPGTLPARLAYSFPPDFLPSGLFIALYRAMGWCWGRFDAGFIVQDGTIWRTTMVVFLDVPPNSIESDWSYTVMVGASSRSSLIQDPRSGGAHMFGDNDQLADHPHYKVGRPGGCTSCLLVSVNYDTQTSTEDIRKFTGIRFSCFTSILPCRIPEDVLPAAKPWHLYDPPDGLPFPRGEHERTYGHSAPCATPLWAIGRDAVAVFEAVPIAPVTVTEHEQNVVYERSTLAGTLLGTSPWPPGTLIDVRRFGGAPEENKPYLIVLYASDWRLGNDTNSIRSKELYPDRCGLLEDTPENRAELQKGFALNDHLRVPEF